MKRETCRFAAKMIQDKRTQEEILAHMNECPVCERIGNRIAFEVQHQLGVDLEEEGKSGEVVAGSSHAITKSKLSGAELLATQIVPARLEAFLRLDVDVTGVKGEGLKGRIRDALAKQQKV